MNSDVEARVRHLLWSLPLAERAEILLRLTATSKAEVQAENMSSLLMQVEKDARNKAQERVRSLALPYTSSVRLGTLPENVTCVTSRAPFTVCAFVNESIGLVQPVNYYSMDVCFDDPSDTDYAVMLRHLCVLGLLDIAHGKDGDMGRDGSGEADEYASTTCYDETPHDIMEGCHDMGLDIDSEDASETRRVYISGSAIYYEYDLVGNTPTAPAEQK
jgi:hypothetical protein